MMQNDKTKIVLIFLISIVSALFSFSGELGADAMNKKIDEEFQRKATMEGVERLKELPQIIESFPSQPSDEQIMKFTRNLGFLKNSQNYNELRSEADSFYAEIQTILIKIPGHAYAFERYYQKAKSDVIAGKSYWGDVQLASERLRNLQHLPSPETMRVLGEMLEETKGAKKEDAFPRQPKESFQMPSSAAEWAVVTLHEIGIENPPDANAHYIDMWLMGDTMAFHPLWHTWWQEVKEGKRTYKFKGSDVVYDYDGPVKTFKKESSSPQTSERKPVSSDGTVKRDASVTEEEPVTESRGPMIWTAAAVGALLIGIWRLWIVNKKTA